MRARTAGWVTGPGVVWKTIVALSPDCPGKRVLSRSSARWESELGRSKLLLNVAPAVPAASAQTTRIPIQPRTVILRWRTHQAARRRIRGFLHGRRRLRANAAPARHLLAQPHALALADLPVLLQVLRVRHPPGAPARARRGARAARPGIPPLGQGAAGADRRAPRGQPRGPRAPAGLGPRGLHRLRGVDVRAGAGARPAARTRTSACSPGTTWPACARSRPRRG